MKSWNRLEEDFSEKSLVRCEAFDLKQQLDHFETVFMTIFWNVLIIKVKSFIK